MQECHVEMSPQAILKETDYCPTTTVIDSFQPKERYHVRAKVTLVLFRLQMK